FQLNAQQLEQKNFVQYTTANGLSHNSITGIAQDSAGYIWLTTPAGLNRFNGHQFVQYHSNADSLSLASETLAGLTWLGKSKLGIYTSGLHIVNTATAEAYNLFVPYHRQQLQYKFNMMERAMGDEKGNTYVLGRSGFYHFDKDDKLVSRFDYYTEAQVPVAHFFFGRELLQLDQKRLLIVSIAGLYLYDKETKVTRKMVAGDYPLLDEFLNYPDTPYIFIQHKPGNIFILRSLKDSLTYINIAQNRKVVSKLPFSPIRTELHYRSRLLSVNDSTLYITGHNSGLFKMRFSPGTGKVELCVEKYFSSYQCNALFKDRNNNLWIGTNKGLFRQDEGRSQVEVALLPSFLKDSFPNIAMNRVYVDGNRLYAGTRSMGNLLVYDKSKMQLLRTMTFDRHKKKSGHSFNILCIVEADADHLLLGTDGWPLLINKEGTRDTPMRPPYWNDEHDWCGEMFKDSKGNIWISAGLVSYYDTRQKTFSFILPKIQATSQIQIPEVIREDSSGNIWMVGHGLSRYNTSLQLFDRRIDSFPFLKMPDMQVSAMVIDKVRNNIWFNSKNNGLICYNIGNGSFRFFTTADGLPENSVAALTIAGNQLWIACYSGLACMDLKTSRITGFGKEDGFPDMPILNRTNFFYDSAAHQLYISFAYAVTRFNPDKLLRQKMQPQVFIENLTFGDQKPVFLPANTITTSWKSNQVSITIGAINFSDAAAQNFAYRIITDSTTPWTKLGNQPSFSISSLSPGKHRIQVKTYSVTNRWPEQVKELTLIVTPPIWLENWFLFVVCGLLLISIYLYIQWRIGIARKKEMEKTQIEKLKADDYKNQFELEQISNYFSSSLTGKKTEEVLWDVAGNLIGRMNYEDCVIYLWNENKTRMIQKAAYGPKGKPEAILEHVFEVEPGQGIVGHVVQTRQPILVNDTRKDSRYRVDDKFRLSEITVPIIHNDELLGVIDLEHSLPDYFSERDVKILTTIATLIGNKLKQIESEQSLEAKQRELAGINEQLAEARLSALQAQMNPHFVFNALNSIKRMILDGDNEKASRYLSKFALMIRMTLEHSKELFVTLDENIEYLKAYLDMEKLRFDDSFTYSISADDNLDTSDTVLPSMMIQPLVENAIWHGLMQAGDNKKITVVFSQNQNKIVCTVEDNGIGIRKAEVLKQKQRPLHRSVGLENLQKRIKIMNEKYNTACSLGIIDLKDTDINKTGTRVVLQFNLMNA
ncbi:MAG: histidine kinase, partial [Chitinophagaceae bacterium]